MRVNVEEKLKTRIDELVAKGERALTTHRPNPPGVIGFATLDHGAFTEWRTQSLAFLTNLLGPEHVYVANFQSELERGGYRSCAEAGIGILKATREDLAGGYLTDVRTLVSAEVFTDFLDMAAHLLDNEYKDPAASLCGAVLEDGLRRIADNAGVKIRKRDDLSVLNQKLATAGVYTRLVQKQVAVWTDIRNNADHGEFGEYSKQDVVDMHKGVSTFLGQHLT